MKVSIELTLLPLHNNFEEHIINFIKRLRASEFTVLENPMSTQVYGDYDKVMPFLTEEIKKSFEDQENVVVNLKMVKSDRSNYEPHF
ncbi:thiamine-binding protein [Wenyingzhuangia sp. chi5]|uniref:Thiamine-binding protein n=1 Tax=Wenyingzhuangia gilva TaxID=3057677 RepID=A0ABT8VTE3_9FLAO|nr:thiamine-binding protein [Wenyingzhuangia sp. chi5]MDO3695200.1 thiamine-binding protein [Wenyingzhuangia sp. chi5]